MSYDGVEKLLWNVISAPTTGIAFNSVSSEGGRTFQAVITGTGVVTATVIIEASNNGIDFLTLGTITLSGTNTTNDGFASSAAWVFHRARLTAISGTDASVTVLMGC